MLSKFNIFPWKSILALLIISACNRITMDGLSLP